MQFWNLIKMIYEHVMFIGCFSKTTLLSHSTATATSNTTLLADDVMPKEQILTAYYLTTYLIVHHYPSIISLDYISHVIQTLKETIRLPCIISHTREILPSVSLLSSHLSEAKFARLYVAFCQLQTLFRSGTQ